MEENVLKDISCYIFDMDGTVYCGNTLLHGAKELFNFFNENKIKYYFLTNNSSNTGKNYLRKLKDFGFDFINENQIITSGDIVIDYLKELNFKKIYLVGTPELEQQFIENNFQLINEKNKLPDCVVIGFDKTFNYNKSEIALHYLRKDIPFISTNEDLICPIEGNEFIPDCGSITSMLEAASGRKSYYIGKPRKQTFNYLLKYSKVSINEIAIVGDRLYTDIATGYNNNFISIAVLTGEFQIDDLDKSQIKPDFIFPSINELFLLLLKMNKN